MNESKTIEIIYDILQRPLLRYTVGPIRRIRELRIKITIKYGEEYMFFYPKNLIIYPVKGQFFVHTGKSFAKILLDSGGQTYDFQSDYSDNH